MRKRTNKSLISGKTKMYAAALGLATAGTFVLSSGGASAHGYTDQPLSRQKMCASGGGVANCGAIQWEPQSVEGLKGFPAAGPADGQICSAGHTNFSQLDQPKTPGVRPGRRPRSARGRATASAGSSPPCTRRPTSSTSSPRPAGTRTTR